MRLRMERRVVRRPAVTASAPARAFGLRSGCRRQVLWLRRGRGDHLETESWHPYAASLIRWVEKDGEITMPELAAKLVAEHGVVAHPASLSKFLIKQGFSVKKNAAGNRGRSR